jgi:phosphoribosylanthranilate isomerase
MKLKSPIKLKVCGMRDHDNIREVAALHPDYMGFIFYSKSPRFVGDEFRMPVLPPSLQKVGVFVDERIDVILEKIRIHGLDVIQLHGKESVNDIMQLKLSGVQVWKVFSIDDDFDFNALTPYEQDADLFLFDTKGKYHGGNAKTFNWNVLHRYGQQVPFMLSGGLSAENIGDIAMLDDMNIVGVDVNSGAEVSPARKDPQLVLKIKQELDKLIIN